MIGKISIMIGKTSTNFDRLRNRVWKNKHLSIKTKVRIYEACILYILLYRSKSWAAYRPQKSKLSAFHTQNLRFILAKTWEGKMTNEDVFKIPASCLLSSKLKYICLRWAGHVNRMPPFCIPELILQGVLANGTRVYGDFVFDLNTPQKRKKWKKNKKTNKRNKIKQIKCRAL